jgi:hypothetical protein
MLKRGHPVTAIAGLLTTAVLTGPVSAATVRTERESGPATVRFQVSHEAAVLDAEGSHKREEAISLVE